MAAARRRETLAYEAVEFGGALAEEEVRAPHRLPGSNARGTSSVVIDFLDPDLFAAFWRAGVIREGALLPSWEVVRTWSEAGGDLILDETMALRVVSHLNREFAGGLRARVVSLIDR